MVSWLRARGIQEASGYTLQGLQSLGMTGVFLALGLGFGVKRLFDVCFLFFRGFAVELTGCCRLQLDLPGMHHSAQRPNGLSGIQ